MYEAHIAITTDTTEQLEKVKSQLGLTIKYLDTDPSADKSGEGVSAGKTSPTSIPLPNSRDISAMGNVAEELAKFRSSMADSFSPNTYVPVNVEFKRYRSLPGRLTQIAAYIPVDSEHSGR